MSRIQIVCDRCGQVATLLVRQPHEARDVLNVRGWTTKSEGGNRWGKPGAHREDYCPECSG